VSICANVLLFGANSTVAYLTGSLSLLASAVDSFLDLISQIIIFFALRSNRNVDRARWPLGRSRMEPVGIIVVASLMGVAALQIGIESTSRFVRGLQDASSISRPELTALTVGLMSAAIVIKACLFVYCFRLRHVSHSMYILAEDHRNDVLSNTVALSAAAFAYAHPDGWWVDPVGAVLISVYIFLRWVHLGREQAAYLVGKAPEPAFLNLVTNLAEAHHATMTCDVVRAYHFGERLLVEVEVIMPSDTTLLVAHDESLSLQKKIELLEEVERCHVHVDYVTRGGEDEHKMLFDVPEQDKATGYARVDPEGVTPEGVV
jgi:cation diffusion facilitator family transporter